jgi:hypothetical protein
VFSHLAAFISCIESERKMTQTFKNLKEEKKFYREKYGVSGLRENTIKQILRNETPSDKFIIDTGLWSFISRELPLTIEFIEKFKENIVFSSLSENEKIEFEVIKNYHEQLIINMIAVNQNVPESFLDENIDRLTDPYVLLRNKTLSNEFIAKHFDLLLTREAELFGTQTIPVNLLVANKEKIDMDVLSRNGKFSEEHFIVLKDDLVWYRIIDRIKYNHFILPTEILEEYKAFLNLSYILQYQPIEESYIEKNYHKLNTESIWCSQKLSTEFIRAHKEDIIWGKVYFQPQMPMEILEDNIERIDYNAIERIQLSETILREILIKEDDSKKFYHYRYSNDYAIANYQDFSKEFYKEFSKKLDKYDLNDNKKLNQNVKNLYNQKMKIKNMLNKNK